MTTHEVYPIEGFTTLRELKGTGTYYLADNIEKDEEQGILECDIYTIILGHATYETMVAKCIECKYNTDAQLALLYNYQNDAETYAADMQTYQEWRTYCKSACKELFGIDTE